MNKLTAKQIVAYGIAMASAAGAFVVAQQPQAERGSRRPKDHAEQLREAKRVLSEVVKIQERYHKRTDNYISEEVALAVELMKKRGLNIPSWIDLRRLSASDTGWAAQVLTPAYWCAVSHGVENPVKATAKDSDPTCIGRPADLGKPVTAPEDSVADAKAWLLELKVAQEAWFADSNAFTPDLQSLAQTTGRPVLLSPPAGYDAPVVNAFGDVWSASLRSGRYVCGMAVGATENPVALDTPKGTPVCQLTQVR